MKNTISALRLILPILILMLSSCTYSQSFFPVRGTGMPVNKDYNVPDLKILAASSEESSIPNKEFFVYAR